MDHMDEYIINMKEQFKKTEERSQNKDLDHMIEEIKSHFVKQNELDLEMQELLLFQDKFKIYIPSSFVQMDLKKMKMKYPNESRPTVIYTNKSETVDIGLNYIKEQIDEDLIPDFRKIMQNSYMTVNPSSKILDTGEFELGERIISYYSFTNFAIGGQMYNLIFLLSLNGEILVVNQNCLKKDMSNYEPLFYGIMNTVEVL